MSTRKEDIANNLAHVREKIQVSARSSNRELSEIKLIAVTKTFPAIDVEILHELGIRDFGENRDSEGAAKSKEVQGDWHFQGQIQGNKLKSITKWATFIHSLDSHDHLEKIATLCKEREGTPLGIFIQVSLDGAHGRGGVPAQELTKLADSVISTVGIQLMGLMAVAPLGIEADKAFAELAVIHRAFSANFPTATALSAGMSGDYESAISHGATHIRVGSSILGSRTPEM
jgi:pyridoxal phosphate enzyme (YggS family)